MLLGSALCKCFGLGNVRVFSGTGSRLKIDGGVQYESLDLKCQFKVTSRMSFELEFGRKEIGAVQLNNLGSRRFCRDLTIPRMYRLMSRDSTQH